ncbi:putative ATPase [Elusimicrobium posterum]|uniref:ATP/GTP-binding protein n=1 Tax=Elusimicrobium posterum TaxID=3116653 RepID=UPI003C72F731
MKKRIVLTGGPSGGKTTALSIIKESFGAKVEIVKEAATMIYAGGYPRNDSSPRHIVHAQRIIYFATKELEALAEETSKAKLVVCDRGTLDGAVYWPKGCEDFLEKMNTTKEAEFKRYDAIVHLSPPQDPAIYQTSLVRTESLEGAMEVDRKILEVWEGHPRRYVIEKDASYLKKAELIKELVADILGE